MKLGCVALDLFNVLVIWEVSFGDVVFIKKTLGLISVFGFGTVCLLVLELIFLVWSCFHARLWSVVKKAFDFQVFLRS